MSRSTRSSAQAQSGRRPQPGDNLAASNGGADVVEIPRAELETLHARLGELRARAAAAEREADQAKLGFLFEMRFDQAVREGKASEAERSVWRQAYDEDPGAVRDMLGFTWAGRAS